jgi:hypothetical protein
MLIDEPSSSAEKKAAKMLDLNMMISSRKHTLWTHRSSRGMAVKSSSAGGAPNSSIAQSSGRSMRD